MNHRHSVKNFIRSGQQWLVAFVGLLAFTLGWQVTFLSIPQAAQAAPVDSTIQLLAENPLEAIGNAANAAVNQVPGKDINDRPIEGMDRPAGRIDRDHGQPKVSTGRAPNPVEPDLRTDMNGVRNSAKRAADASEDRAEGIVDSVREFFGQ